MLATTERIELLDLADELSMMILQSDIAEEYYHYLYKVRKDKEAQDFLRQFVIMKERYDEVQRFGKYHPDFREVTAKVRELKRQLDLHDSIALFKQAEAKLQNLLDEISVDIGRAVSEYIKVPTGNPFFDSLSGCSGGCGSGNSCGCS